MKKIELLKRLSFGRLGLHQSSPISQHDPLEYLQITYTDPGIVFLRRRMYRGEDRKRPIARLECMMIIVKECI